MVAQKLSSGSKNSFEEAEDCVTCLIGSKAPFLSQGATAGPLLTYQYDGNGNRTMQIEYQNGVAETTTYGYDGADRLTHVEYPGEIVDYGYDGVGNRLSETKTTKATGTVLSAKTLAYNALNQLTAITDTADPQNDATLDYDDNGNLVTKTTATATAEYVYDSQNRLINVFVDSTNVASYAYDAEGLRIGKESLASTVSYVRDGLDVLTEYDATDTAIASYQYANGLRVMEFRNRLIPLKKRQVTGQEGL